MLPATYAKNSVTSAEHITFAVDSCMAFAPDRTLIALTAYLNAIRTDTASLGTSYLMILAYQFAACFTVPSVLPTQFLFAD